VADEAQRIWALVQSGDRALARVEAGAFARRRPGDAEAHLIVGLLDLDVGAVDTALESLRRATFLDSTNALAHFSLGRAYQRRREPERARAALSHARRLIATLADEVVVPGGGDLTAGDLRLAVEAALKER
jgi:chemotaxis protein methyltransferase CheR